jgi:C4-dicarboxylate-specific signal transduction histidine kinase
VERERADALARLAEAERARSAIERWAAMGQVADQVAHDVNSPLGALRSSLAYAREEILGGRPEGALEALEDGTACVERIRVIVAELGPRGGFQHAGARGRTPGGADDPERG